MKNLLVFTLAILVVSTVSCKVSSKKKHAYMEKAYATFNESFPDADVKLLHDSVRIVFPNSIVFKTGSTAINELFDSKIVRFAKILHQYSHTNVLIVGHTDNTGEEKINKQLSKERSIAVQTRLLEQKVKLSRIETWGLGDKSPVASNETEEGRSQNRRAEFVILYSSK